MIDVSELERLEKEATQPRQCEHTHLHAVCKFCAPVVLARRKRDEFLRNNVSTIIEALKERDELREALNGMLQHTGQTCDDSGQINGVGIDGGHTESMRFHAAWLKAVDAEERTRKSQLSERQEKP